MFATEWRQKKKATKVIKISFSSNSLYTSGAIKVHYFKDLNFKAYVA